MTGVHVMAFLYSSRLLESSTLPVEACLMTLRPGPLAMLCSSPTCASRPCRHCLRNGVFVFHLVVEKYCSCTWVGLVDETPDMST